MESRERMEQMMEQYNRYRVDGEVVPEKELFLTMEEIVEHFKEDELVCGGQK